MHIYKAKSLPVLTQEILTSYKVLKLTSREYESNGLGCYGLFLATRGLIDRDWLLKANCERLQTCMPEAGFEPADYSTKWQGPTILPSPGWIS